MTQEEKQILLRDLCVRLPYGVKVHITNEWFYDKIEPYDRRLDCDVIKHIRENQYTVKPYLRSISSMTEEEKNELKKVTNGLCITMVLEDVIVTTKEGFDWFNVHHFDYRDLIPMGLALEAPKDMYKQ
jgi:hypothetical protein